MDYSLYKDIYDLYGSRPLDAVMKFAANDLVFVLVAAVALLFLIPWSRRRLERRIGAVTATLSLGIALAITKVISDGVDRTRPFVAHHLVPHIHHAADGSFPSDHTTAAFALAAGVFFYDRVVGSVMLVAGLLIGFARVFEGLHYPSDVAGGALVGIFVALVLSFTPLRRVVAAIAGWCSGLWERILAAVFGRRVAQAG